jgi:hypothetical protein
MRAKSLKIRSPSYIIPSKTEPIGYSCLVLNSQVSRKEYLDPTFLEGFIDKFMFAHIDQKYPRDPLLSLNSLLS